MSRPEQSTWNGARKPARSDATRSGNGPPGAYAFSGGSAQRPAGGSLAASRADNIRSNSSRGVAAPGYIPPTPTIATRGNADMRSLLRPHEAVQPERPLQRGVDHALVPL